MLTNLSHAAFRENACHIHIEGIGKTTVHDESLGLSSNRGDFVSRSIESDFIGIRPHKKDRRWKFSKSMQYKKGEIDLILTVDYKLATESAKKTQKDSFIFQIEVSKKGDNKTYASSIKLYNTKKSPPNFVLKNSHKFDLDDDYLYTFGVQCFTKKEKKRLSSRGVRF